MTQALADKYAMFRKISENKGKGDNVVQIMRTIYASRS
jgi:hypothetical protein